MEKRLFREIAILIPAYNEQETLGSILSKIPGKVLNHKVVLVVVDDGSLDKTSEVAKKYTEHVVKLDNNRGVGVATKAGLEYISNLPNNFRFLIKLDGDGQHRLHFIPQVVANLCEGSDMVICSRFHPLSDQTHTPVDRLLLNCTFNEIISKIIGKRITDARSGYMGFQYDLIVKIIPYLIVERYGIPMEIILPIWNEKSNLNITEIPHPAMYDLNISHKLRDKYQSERNGDKSIRVLDAHTALLMVVEDIKIPREHVLEMNGYSHY